MTRRGRGRPPYPDVLTPAEWAILDQWRHGLGRTAIAERRGISSYGVRYHLRNIAGKLGVETTADLRHWPGIPATSARAHAVTPPLGRSTRMTAQPVPIAALTAGGPLGPGELGQVSLYARDAKVTEAWYRGVLDLPHVFTFGDLVFFDCGGTRLYIHAVGEEKWRPGSVLYFLVPDIQAAHDQLTARGVKFAGAPHMIFKDDQSGVEEWMAFFEDPDTNTLAIMARVSPA